MCGGVGTCNAGTRLKLVEQHLGVPNLDPTSTTLFGGQGRIHDEPDGGYQASHQPIRFRVIGRGQSPGALVT